MPNTSLDTSDAIELAEMLQFLADWLDASPTRFVGHPAHGAPSCEQTCSASSSPRC